MRERGGGRKEEGVRGICTMVAEKRAGEGASCGNCLEVDAGISDH